MEERTNRIFAAASELSILGVPAFLFQEGGNPAAKRIFSEVAKLTGGAWCAFDGSSVQQLRDLLSAVAAYAAGGKSALENFTERKGGATRQLTHQFRLGYDKKNERGVFFPGDSAPMANPRRRTDPALDSTANERDRPSAAGQTATLPTAGRNHYRLCGADGVGSDPGTVLAVRLSGRPAAGGHTRCPDIERRADFASNQIPPAPFFYLKHA